MEHKEAIALNIEVQLRALSRCADPLSFFELSIYGDRQVKVFSEHGGYTIFVKPPKKRKYKVFAGSVAEATDFLLHFNT